MSRYLTWQVLDANPGLFGSCPRTFPSASLQEPQRWGRPACEALHVTVGGPSLWCSSYVQDQSGRLSQPSSRWPSSQKVWLGPLCRGKQPQTEGRKVHLAGRFQLCPVLFREPLSCLPAPGCVLEERGLLSPSEHTSSRGLRGHPWDLKHFLAPFNVGKEPAYLWDSFPQE